MTYAWGKIGADSEVAKLKASVDPTFKIDPTEKYAEVKQFLSFLITEFS